jgi:signal transduction histidine kinase
MSAFALWALVQREQTMVAEARRETQAYATALGLALDAAFRDPERSSVPEIVERITRQPAVYAVVVYDGDGRRLFGPDSLPATPPPAPVAGVLASGRPTEYERAEDDVDVFSVVHPVLSADARVVGAFEVLQPLASLQGEQARTRVRFLLNTLVLLVAVTAVILWLVRRLVSRPLAGFADGVRALGTGRLDHRVDPGTTIGELADVSVELNRMAAGLEKARGDVLRSAEERLALERHVRQSEKMAMVGQLAAGLAHEVGAPLHVIRGRADLLAKRFEAGDARSRDVRIITEQIDRITGIVHGLLDFARQKEPRLSSVDVVPVADGVIELLDTELRPAGIRARRTGLDAATVRGDRDQLQQVLLNLLLNAVQALRDQDDQAGDRSIEVAVATDARDGRDEVVLTVSDSGPGIPEALRERIFEPFFTTRPDGRGTGLGLAIARRIVEEHGGVVTVADRAGGTTVVVRLPRVPRENGAHDAG